MRQQMLTSILITSGNGPAECNQAVAGVLGRMQEEAGDLGLDLDVSATVMKHGIRSSVVVVHGKRRGDFAKRWCGTIQWRSKSKLRPNHKRANWFVGVFQLTQNATAKIVVHPSDVVFESFRAGGPDGQH